jgi:hypothetical protein
LEVKHEGRRVMGSAVIVAVRRCGGSPVSDVEFDARCQTLAWRM